MIAHKETITDKPPFSGCPSVDSGCQTRVLFPAQKHHTMLEKLLLHMMKVILSHAA
jgi:hypothetical protein